MRQLGLMGTQTAAVRGGIDSYYHRSPQPHRVVDGVEVPVEEGSEDWHAYMDAWYRNTDFKDWGTND